MAVVVAKSGLAWVDVRWPAVPGTDHYDLIVDGRLVQSVRGTAVTDQLTCHWPGRTYRYQVNAIDASGHKLAEMLADPYAVLWPEPLAGDWPVLVITIDHPDVVLRDNGVPMTDGDVSSALLWPVWRYTPGLVPFVHENSFGRLRFVPEFARVRLDKPSTEYPKTWDGQQALHRDILTALGPLDLAPYRLGILLTGGGYAGGAGGQLPGTRFSVCTVTSPSILAHEVGHLLGFNHAGRLLAPPGDLLHWGGTNPYGDTLDPMGGWQAFGHYSALNKILAGWLPQGRGIETRGPGSYVLSAVDEPGDGRPAALVVPLDDAGNAWVIERVTRVNVNGGFRPCWVARLRPAQAVFYTTSQLLTWRASEPWNVSDKWQPPFDRDHPFLDPERDLGFYVVDAETVRLGAASEAPPAPVIVAPTVTQEPEDAVVTAESSDSGVASFSLSVSGTAPLVIAWYLDGSPVVVDGGASVTLTANAGAHVVYAVISNVAGYVVTRKALFEVLSEAPIPPQPPPTLTITWPLAGALVGVNRLVPLTAEVRYASELQWTVNGVSWVSPWRVPPGKHRTYVIMATATGPSGTKQATVTVTSR